MDSRRVPIAFLAALALSSADAPRALAKEEPSPPRTAPEAIDAAIERGVAWVEKEQDRDGGFSGDHALGRTALAALALLHAGTREDGATPGDKALTAALAYLDREAPGRGRAKMRDPGTYETSLLLLVYRARGRAEDRARMQRYVDLLALTQAKNGQWSYSGEPVFDPRGGPDVGDNSNTHFAVLGLGTAVGDGLEVPERTLKRAQVWWRACIQEDGGFGYSSGGGLRAQSSGSMTAAGIACLAVLGAALEDEAPDPMVARAVERLGRGFSVEENFGPVGRAQEGRRTDRQRAPTEARGWLHYYLWTLERAMVLSGRERVGSHDWFAEGTAHLLRTQYDDGSWRQESPLYATCFALLFLSRAADPPRSFTPPPTAAPTTPSDGVGAVDGAPARPPPPPGGPDAWLRSAVPPLTLRDHCLSAGASCLPALARALDDADPLVRRRAFEALSLLLPPEVVAGADARPLPRGRLQLWIRRHARILQVGPDRFVPP